MTEQQDWQRLGRYLVHARVALGFRNREAFARHLGFTHSKTLSDIESGRRSNYSAPTIALIEQSYGWDMGSIDAVLAGGEPTVRPTVQDASDYVADVGPSPGPSGISDEQVLAVIRATRQQLDDLERQIGERSVGGTT